MTIDFSNGKTPEDLNVVNEARSALISDLKALRAGVEAGDGEYGVFYKLREYKNPSGATTARRGLIKRADDLPGTFEFRKVTFEVDETGKDGKPKRHSELWAAYPDAEPVEYDDED